MPTTPLTANGDLNADYGSASPATLYAALATAAPNYTANSGNGTIVEPSTGTQYGGYARVAVTNNSTNFPAAAGGAKTTGTAITFPTSTGGAGSPVTVSYLVFVTTASGAGYRIVDALPITGGLTIAAGQAASFAAGSITITES